MKPFLSNAHSEKSTSGLLIFILTIFILASTGCLPLFYRTNTTTEIDNKKVSTLINQQRYFILHADSTTEKGIQGLSLHGDTIKGLIVTLPKDHTKNLEPDPTNEKNRLGTKAKDRKTGLTEVHLYTNTPTTTDSLILPLSTIKRMDVYELNEKATRRNHTWQIAGIIVVGVGLPLLFVAMMLNMPY
jgi:hypothetical protein